MATLNTSKLPEEFTCPVCFELLVTRIFQCKNGHIICEKCLKPLTICPQCRVPYENSPSRNLALENVLDKMRFDCKNSKMGCDAKLQRKDILAHDIRCKYGSPSVSFCRILGYNCGELVNPNCVSDASWHIQSDHEVSTISPTKELNVLLRNSKIIRGQHWATRGCWEPILIKDKESGRELLLRVAVWTDVKSFSLMIDVMLVKMLGFANNHIVETEVSLILPNTLKQIDKTWTTKAISLTDCKEAFPVQFMRFQLNDELYEFLCSNHLGLKFTFRETPYFTTKSPETTSEVHQIGEKLDLKPMKLHISYFHRHYLCSFTQDEMKIVSVVLIGFLFLLVRLIVGFYHFLGFWDSPKYRH